MDGRPRQNPAYRQAQNVERLPRGSLSSLRPFVSYLGIMAEITVRPLGDETFEVVIEEEGSSSAHLITATNKHVELLCGGCEPAHLVEASVRFLLDREPKESIMSQFDLDVIAGYFPEYATAMSDYL